MHQTLIFHNQSFLDLVTARSVCFVILLVAFHPPCCFTEACLGNFLVKVKNRIDSSVEIDYNVTYYDHYFIVLGVVHVLVTPVTLTCSATIPWSQASEN